MFVENMELAEQLPPYCCRGPSRLWMGRLHWAWVRFPPNVGYVFPQMYFVVFDGILMYPSRVRYRCVSKRPSKYTQNTRKIPITEKNKYRPGIGLAIPVSRYRSGDTSLTGTALSVWRYLCPDRYMTIRCDTSKYTPIRGDTRQYDAILQNTHRYVAIHDNTMRYFKIHTDT